MAFKFAIIICVSTSLATCQSKYAGDIIKCVHCITGKFVTNNTEEQLEIILGIERKITFYGIIEDV